MKLDNSPGVVEQKQADEIQKEAPGGVTTGANQPDTNDAKETHVEEKKPNQNGEVIKTKSQEDEDLGIYEDTDDGDDLTDTELELEKLREEKRKRDEEERKEKERQAAVGADGRHAGGDAELSKRDSDRKPDGVQDKTFLTGGGMEMEAEKDKIEAVQDYLDRNILPDPLHAQGVKRKAGFSQSAFSRTDHVTNMKQQLEESM